MNQDQTGAYALKAQNAHNRKFSQAEISPAEFWKWVDAYAQDVPTLLRENERGRLAREVAEAFIERRETMGDWMAKTAGSADRETALSRGRVAKQRLDTAVKEYQRWERDV